MANEITIGGSLALNNDGKKAALTGTDRKDQAGTHYVQRVDTIGTSEESIGKGDIGTIGYVAFKNVGATGIIKVGGAAGAYALDLAPGEFAGPLKWSTNAVFAIADTVNSELELLLIEA